MKLAYFDQRTILGRAALKLAKAAERAVKAAYDSKDFTDRTYNLHDSYAAAVYYNSELIVDSVYVLEPQKATEPKDWYGQSKSGHSEALDYFMNFKPRKKGLTMVLIAAMPYADILEGGKGGLRRKYKVISGANSIMRNIAAEMQGMFGRRRGSRTSVSVTPIKK